MRYSELQEALPLSTAKDYVKGWDSSKYKEIFSKYANDSKAYRIYLPIIDGYQATITPPYDIKKYLNDQGIEISDYINGIGKDKYKRDVKIGKDKYKRDVKIGKVLSKQPDLKKKFDADPTRAVSQKGKLMVCISRHPYDIASMSTNRGWTSCLDIMNGSNKYYIKPSIKGGAIVAYLISEKDKNVKDPIARVMIVPYVNPETGDFIFVQEEKVYGTSNPGFKQTVQKWIDEVNGPDGDGIYCIDKRMVYSDNPVNAFIHNLDRFKNKLRNMGAKGFKEHKTAASYDLSFTFLGDDFQIRLMDIDTENAKIKYFKNGKLHREKGPAVISVNGERSYWKNGKKVSKES